MVTAREMWAAWVVAIVSSAGLIISAVVSRKPAQNTTADAASQLSAAFTALVDQLQEERKAANAEVEHLRDVCKKLERQVSRFTRYIDALEKVLRDNGIDPPGLPPEAVGMEA